MAETKPDWGLFWKLWGLIVAGLLTGSGVLYQAKQPAWGFRLLIAGLVGLGVLGLRLLAVLAPPFYAGLSKKFRYALGLLRGIAQAIWGVIVRTGARLLGPFVRQIMRSEGGGTWTAGLNRFGEYGNYDYKIFAIEGQRVASAHFWLFPEFHNKVWNAGFALSFSPFSFDPKSRDNRVFWCIESDEKGLKVICRGESGIGPLESPQASRRELGYLFDIKSFPAKDGNKLSFRVEVGGVSIKAFDLPRDHACNLILFAWAKDGDFRVNFTQIHMRWVPR